MRRRKIVSAVFILLLAVLLLSGCAESNAVEGTEGADGVAGFWAGLWQGLILPVAFIISLFREDTGIYEIHNNGNLYNLGFVLGTWLVFGSLLASKNKR